jgi:hypothetical protein
MEAFLILNKKEQNLKNSSSRLVSNIVFAKITIRHK